MSSANRHSSINRKITVLPEPLVNKIAAGEVIERPASVVKELVENSLDASARSVEIEVREGGKEYIRVTDDGCGMSPDQIKMSFLRHATSKISCVEDLLQVGTLGFRGEALPSIAACAEVEMVSRPADADTAARIRVIGGKILPTEPAGAPPGTTVVVRRLFFNTPARYKFLKQTATERRYIIEYTAHMALARPDVAFSLIGEGRKIISTPGGGDLLAAVSVVHGPELARRVLPVEWECPVATISGYLSPSDETRHNRGGESIFVNGRLVQNHLLYAALEKGYQPMLPPKRYPVAVLHLTVDPALVDVNVHPAKTEVRFSRESDTFKHVMLAVQAALTGTVPMQQKSSSRVAGYERVDSPPGGSLPKPTAHTPERLPVESWRVAEKAPPIAAGGSGYISTAPAGAPGGSDGVEVALALNEQAAGLAEHSRSPLQSRELPSSEAAALRHYLTEVPVLGQVLSTYLVLAAPEGLWLVDQHIAHERVLFERILNRMKDHQMQSLLIPVPVQLSPSEGAVIEEVRPHFTELGLILEPFGGTGGYLVRALPLHLTAAPSDRELRELLVEMADLFGLGGPSPRERMAAAMACRAALKAGKRLSTPAQSTLLKALAATSNPFACPHGRPIIVAIDRTELERRFGRR